MADLMNQVDLLAQIGQNTVSENAQRLNQFGAEADSPERQALREQLHQTTQRGLGVEEAQEQAIQDAETTTSLDPILRTRGTGDRLGDLAKGTTAMAAQTVAGGLKLFSSSEFADEIDGFGEWINSFRSEDLKNAIDDRAQERVFYSRAMQEHVDAGRISQERAEWEKTKYNLKTLNAAEIEDIFASTLGSLAPMIATAFNPIASGVGLALMSATTLAEVTDNIRDGLFDEESGPSHEDLLEGSEQYRGFYELTNSEERARELLYRSLVKDASTDPAVLGATLVETLGDYAFGKMAGLIKPIKGATKAKTPATEKVKSTVAKARSFVGDRARSAGKEAAVEASSELLGSTTRAVRTTQKLKDAGVVDEEQSIWKGVGDEAYADFIGGVMSPAAGAVGRGAGVVAAVTVAGSKAVMGKAGTSKKPQTVSAVVNNPETRAAMAKQAEAHKATVDRLEDSPTKKTQQAAVDTINNFNGPSGESETFASAIKGAFGDRDVSKFSPIQLVETATKMVVSEKTSAEEKVKLATFIREVQDKITDAVSQLDGVVDPDELALYTRMFEEDSDIHKAYQAAKKAAEEANIAFAPNSSEDMGKINGKLNFSPESLSSEEVTQMHNYVESFTANEDYSAEDLDTIKAKLTTVGAMLQVIKRYEQDFGEKPNDFEKVMFEARTNEGPVDGSRGPSMAQYAMRLGVALSTENNAAIASSLANLDRFIQSHTNKLAALKKVKGTKKKASYKTWKHGSPTSFEHTVTGGTEALISAVETELELMSMTREGMLKAYGMGTDTTVGSLTGKASSLKARPSKRRRKHARAQAADKPVRSVSDLLARSEGGSKNTDDLARAHEMVMEYVANAPEGDEFAQAIESSKLFDEADLTDKEIYEEIVRVINEHGLPEPLQDRTLDIDVVNAKADERTQITQLHTKLRETLKRIGRLTDPKQLGELKREVNSLGSAINEYYQAHREKNAREDVYKDGKKQYYETKDGKKKPRYKTVKRQHTKATRLLKNLGYNKNSINTESRESTERSVGFIEQFADQLDQIILGEVATVDSSGKPLPPEQAADILNERGFPTVDEVWANPGVTFVVPNSGQNSQYKDLLRRKGAMPPNVVFVDLKADPDNLTAEGRFTNKTFTGEAMRKLRDVLVNGKGDGSPIVAITPDLITRQEGITAPRLRRFMQAYAAAVQQSIFLNKPELVADTLDAFIAKEEAGTRAPDADALVQEQAQETTQTELDLEQEVQTTEPTEWAQPELPLTKKGTRRKDADISDSATHLITVPDGNSESADSVAYLYGRAWDGSADNYDGTPNPTSRLNTGEYTADGRVWVVLDKPTKGNAQAGIKSWEAMKPLVQAATLARATILEPISSNITKNDAGYKAFSAYMVANDYTLRDGEWVYQAPQALAISSTALDSHTKAAKIELPMDATPTDKLAYDLYRLLESAKSLFASGEHKITEQDASIRKSASTGAAQLYNSYKDLAESYSRHLERIHKLANQGNATEVLTRDYISLLERIEALQVALDNLADNPEAYSATQIRSEIIEPFGTITYDIASNLIKYKGAPSVSLVQSAETAKGRLKALKEAWKAALDDTDRQAIPGVSQVNNKWYWTDPQTKATYDINDNFSQLTAATQEAAQQPVRALPGSTGIVTQDVEANAAETQTQALSGTQVHQHSRADASNTRLFNNNFANQLTEYFSGMGEVGQIALRTINATWAATQRYFSNQDGGIDKILGQVSKSRGFKKIGSNFTLGSATHRIRVAVASTGFGEQLAKAAPKRVRGDKGLNEYWAEKLSDVAAIKKDAAEVNQALVETLTPALGSVENAEAFVNSLKFQEMASYKNRQYLGLMQYDPFTHTGSFPEHVQQAIALATADMFLSWPAYKGRSKPSELADALGYNHMYDELGIYQVGASPVSAVKHSWENLSARGVKYLTNIVEDRARDALEYLGLRTDNDSGVGYTLTGLAQAINTIARITSHTNQDGATGPASVYHVRHMNRDRADNPAYKEEVGTAVIVGQLPQEMGEVDISQLTGAISHAILTDREPLIHLDVPPEVTDRGPTGEKVTAGQHRSATHVANTPKYVDTNVANIYATLGNVGAVQMFGHPDADNPNSPMNEHDRSAKQGVNASVLSGLRKAATVITTAIAEGKHIADVVLYEAVGWIATGRQALEGADTTQGNTMMRAAFTPHRSEVNIKDVMAIIRSDSAGTFEMINDPNTLGTLVAMGQAMGLSTRKMGYEAMRKELRDFYFNPEVMEAANHLAYMAENTAMQPGAMASIENVKRMLGGIEGDWNERATATLTEWGLALQGKGVAADGTFTTTQYVEADGVTNGPFFGGMLLGVDFNSPEWLAFVVRGGFYPAENVDMNTYFSENVAQDNTLDNYTQIALEASTILAQRLDEYAAEVKDPNSQEAQAILAMRNLLESNILEVRMTEDGAFEITRNGAKMPVTMVFYGAGQAAISNDFGSFANGVLREMATAALRTESGGWNRNQTPTLQQWIQENAGAFRSFVKDGSNLNDQAIAYKVLQFVTGLSYFATNKVENLVTYDEQGNPVNSLGVTPYKGSTGSALSGHETIDQFFRSDTAVKAKFDKETIVSISTGMDTAIGGPMMEAMDRVAGTTKIGSATLINAVDSMGDMLGAVYTKALVDVVQDMEFDPLGGVTRNQENKIKRELKKYGLSGVIADGVMSLIKQEVDEMLLGMSPEYKIQDYSQYGFKMDNVAHGEKVGVLRAPTGAGASAMPRTVQLSGDSSVITRLYNKLADAAIQNIRDAFDGIDANPSLTSLVQSLTNESAAEAAMQDPIAAILTMFDDVPGMVERLGIKRETLKQLRISANPELTKLGTRRERLNSIVRIQKKLNELNQRRFAKDVNPKSDEGKARTKDYYDSKNEYESRILKWAKHSLSEAVRVHDLLLKDMGPGYEIVADKLVQRLLRTYAGTVGVPVTIEQAKAILNIDESKTVPIAGTNFTRTMSLGEHLSEIGDLWPKKLVNLGIGSPDNGVTMFPEVLTSFGELRDKLSDPALNELDKRAIFRAARANNAQLLRYVDFNAFLNATTEDTSTPLSHVELGTVGATDTLNPRLGNTSYNLDNDAVAMGGKSALFALQRQLNINKLVIQEIGGSFDQYAAGPNSQYYMEPTNPQTRKDFEEFMALNAEGDMSNTDVASVYMKQRAEQLATEQEEATALNLSHDLTALVARGELTEAEANTILSGELDYTSSEELLPTSGELTHETYRADLHPMVHKFVNEKSNLNKPIHRLVLRELDKRIKDGRIKVEILNENSTRRTSFVAAEGGASGTIYLSHNATGAALLHEATHAVITQALLSYADRGARAAMPKHLVQAVENLHRAYEYAKNHPAAYSDPDFARYLQHAEAARVGKEHMTPEQILSWEVNEFVTTALNSGSLATILANTTTPPAIKRFGGELLKFVRRLFGLESKDFNSKKLLGAIQESFVIAAGTEDTQTSQNTVGGEGTVYAPLLPQLPDLSLVPDELHAGMAEAIAKADNRGDFIDWDRAPATHKTLTDDETWNTLHDAGFNLDVGDKKLFNMVNAMLQTGFKADNNTRSKLLKAAGDIIRQLDDGILAGPNATPGSREYYAGREKMDALRKLKGPNAHTALVALALVDHDFRDTLYQFTAFTGLPDVRDATKSAFAAAKKEFQDGRLTPSLADTIEQLSGKLKKKSNESEEDVVERIANLQQALNDHLARGGQLLYTGIHNAMLSIAEYDNAAAQAAGALGSYMSGLLISEGRDERAEDISRVLNHDLVPNFVRDLATDILGASDRTSDVYALIKKVTAFVQKQRSRFVQGTAEPIVSAFKDQPTPAQWNALRQSLAQTDMGYVGLNAQGGIDAVIDMINNPALVEAQINTSMAALKRGTRNFDTVVRKMNQLAEYMVTGEPGKRLATNAMAIMKESGEQVLLPKDFESEPAAASHQHDMLRHIDIVTSLKAFQQSDNTVLVGMLEAEPEGVRQLVETQAAVAHEEINKTKQGAYIRTGLKGFHHRPSTRNVIAVHKTDVASYVTKGWKEVSDQGSDMVLISAPANIERPFQAGIIQSVQRTHSGYNPQSKTLNSWSTVGYSDRETKDYTLPIYDEEANIVGYTIPLPKDAAEQLKHETNFPLTLGMQRGRQMEEHYAEALNVEVLRILDEQYQEDFAEGRGDEYVNLWEVQNDANYPDRVIKDAVGTISKVVTDNKDVWVRKDQLKAVIGYRIPSMADFWNGTNRLPPAVNEAITTMVEAVLGPKAHMYMNHVEDFFKSLAVEAKNIIVVKSVVVPVINAVSNVIHLMARGVSPVAITKGIIKYSAEARRHVKYEARITEIAAQRLIEKNQTELHKLKVEEDALWAAIQALEIYPLIQAGELSGMTSEIINRDATTGVVDTFSNWLQGVLGKGGVVGKGISEALMLESSHTYNGLKAFVDYGDFIGRAIIMDKWKKSGKYDQRELMNKVAEEFVNYSIAPGRVRHGLESFGLIWFFNFKLRSLKVALSVLRENPLTLFTTMSSIPLHSPIGTFGTSIQDNIVSQYFDDTLKYSVGFGMYGSALEKHPATVMGSMLARPLDF